MTTAPASTKNHNQEFALAVMTIKKMTCLDDLLSEHHVSDFSRTWAEKATPDAADESYHFLKSIGMKDSKIATTAILIGSKPDTLRRNYANLKQMGLSDSKIASLAYLLSRNQESLKKSYETLKKIGLSDSKIASLAYLLSRDPETLHRNYQNLKRIGLSDSKIATSANLLSQNPDTLQFNYNNLRQMGLSDAKIASRAELLCQNPNTLRRNYQNLRNIGLSDSKIASSAQLLSRDPKSLKRNYNTLRRFVSRKLICETATILGSSMETVESNVQFLYQHNIQPSNQTCEAMLLVTKTSTKRKKILWLKRELFKGCVESTFDLIHAYPTLLTNSISYYEKNKDKLQRKAKSYMN